MPRGSTSRPDPRRALGANGERAVAVWYETAGYEVLDRNWRNRTGELDLVVGRDRVVVFCEVKTRRTNTFGAPVEAITREKRQRLRVLAAQWLDAHRDAVREVRFDVASVFVRPGTEPVVEILEGAF